MQNLYLLSRLQAELKNNDFEVYHHCRVSPNDEGISLGQGMIACRGGEEYVSCDTVEDHRDRRP